MVFVKILLGLAGLGIVVFIHELGHFLAARLCKIKVEAFSIGWGKPFLKKKIGDVEYRLGIFPVGGYCKMAGDSDYQEVYDNIQKGINPEEGSFYAASPPRRMLVSVMGPLFNLIFAVIALSFIWGGGFQITTMGNRIVLASDIYPDEYYPADAAGMQTGDRIVEIGNKKINYYHEIQEYIAVNADTPLPLAIDRNGEQRRFIITPRLDKSTGAGRIGVISWVDPVLEAVLENSPAFYAGLKSGDRIIAANGKEIQNSLDMSVLLDGRPDAVSINFMRNGAVQNTQLIPDYSAEAVLGIQWALLRYNSPALPIHAALAKGVTEAWNTLTLTIRSFRLLFKGIDLTQAVSGPVRITYMMGDIAAEGFGQSAGTGIRSMANFLALISIALCIMNLLPLPILDGGMIILFLIEFIRQKPLHPRATAVFQTMGIVIICGLMVFALFGDIMFLVKR